MGHIKKYFVALLLTGIYGTTSAIVVLNTTNEPQQILISTIIKDYTAAPENYENRYPEIPVSIFKKALKPNSKEQTEPFLLKKIGVTINSGEKHPHPSEEACSVVEPDTQKALSWHATTEPKVIQNSNGINITSQSVIPPDKQESSKAENAYKRITTTRCYMIPITDDPTEIQNNWKRFYYYQKPELKNNIYIPYSWHTQKTEDNTQIILDKTNGNKVSIPGSVHKTNWPRGNIIFFIPKSIEKLKDEIPYRLIDETLYKKDVTMHAKIIQTFQPTEYIYESQRYSQLTSEDATTCMEAPLPEKIGNDHVIVIFTDNFGTNLRFFYVPGATEMKKAELISHLPI